MARPILCQSFSSLAWLVLLIVCEISVPGAASNPRKLVGGGDDSLSMSSRHEQWMSRHGRVYKDSTEKERRFQIFKANVEYIESHNRVENRKYKLGINQFTDLTNDEFRTNHLGFVPSPARNNIKTLTLAGASNLTDVSSSLDWRTQGAVTPVKDQGKCGCCWAFSAAAATEGITKLSTGQLVSLSEQQLLDCVTDSDGCNGGNMEGAFRFIINNGGLTSEAGYPYKESKGTCTAASTAATIAGYKRVPANSEASLLQAVAAQPVSVAINGHTADFQSYAGGVFDGECGPQLSHAVLVVGYGAETDGTKYWIVKNSWGALWGENGYMRLLRDFDQPEGLCGIAMQASYPTA